MYRKNNLSNQLIADKLQSLQLEELMSWTAPEVRKSMLSTHFVAQSYEDVCCLTEKPQFIVALTYFNNRPSFYSSLFQTPILLSNYNMGRDESIFPNANSFMPERWLRENKEEDEIHPFTTLPFGFGARSCLGKD